MAAVAVLPVAEAVVVLGQGVLGQFGPELCRLHQFLWLWTEETRGNLVWIKQNYLNLQVVTPHLKGSEVPCPQTEWRELMNEVFSYEIKSK